jgi:hypothetical protein
VTKLAPTPTDHLRNHASAVHFLQERAQITKLLTGSWRVWLRSKGIRVYGATRWAALDEAAKRLLNLPPSCCDPI